MSSEVVCHGHDCNLFVPMSALNHCWQLRSRMLVLAEISMSRSARYHCTDNVLWAASCVFWPGRELRPNAVQPERTRVARMPGWHVEEMGDGHACSTRQTSATGGTPAGAASGSSSVTELMVMVEAIVA